MTETELDQIDFIEDRFKLYLSLSNDNLGSYTVSDISLDEAIQNISLDKNEIEPAILDQIRC